jgi:hypothetical protein
MAIVGRTSSIGNPYAECRGAAQFNDFLSRPIQVSDTAIPCAVGIESFTFAPKTSNMQTPPRRERSIAILVATCVLIVNAGCNEPYSIQSLESSANAKNQVFDELLIGTWAAFIKDEPYILLTVTRDTPNSKDYAIKMHDAEAGEGVAGCSGSMRLLRIGDYEFVELESTIPKDTPPEERMTVDGDPLRTAYSLWRITHRKDTLQVWGFEDKKILESLPKSEVVPSVPQGKNSTIANCSTDELQKFLLKNGGKMTKKAEDFKRCEEAANQAMHRNGGGRRI